MAIDNNPTKTSFFKKIGNWFNKNGNTVGKGMQIAGTSAMGVGMIGMAVKAFDDNSSIFGGCGCGMFNPYMMGGFDQCSIFGGFPFMGGSSFMGGCPTSMAAMTGYQYGAMLAQQDLMNNQYGMFNPYSQFNNQLFQNNSHIGTSIAKDTWDDTKVEFDAKKLEDNEGNSDAGKTFDEKTDKLMSDEDKVELTEDTDEASIKKALIAQGQNAVKFMDKDSDDFVSLAEYIAIEKSKKGYDVTIVKRAFEKMDLNNDGKLDYTELASMYGTFTTTKGKENKPTNSITSDNYKAWSKALGDPASNAPVIRNKYIREWLFGSES